MCLTTGREFNYAGNVHTERHLLMCHAALAHVARTGAAAATSSLQRSLAAGSGATSRSCSSTHADLAHIAGMHKGRSKHLIVAENAGGRCRRRIG